MKMQIRISEIYNYQPNFVLIFFKGAKKPLMYLFNYRAYRPIENIKKNATVIARQSPVQSVNIL